MPLRVISKNDSMKTFIKHNIMRQNYLEPLEDLLTIIRHFVHKHRKKMNLVVPLQSVAIGPQVQETDM